MGGSPVVLVVEDEWLIRLSVVQALREAGCEVWDVGSGEAAIALLHATDRVIDVLLTDIQLGGQISGWDVADAVRLARPAASIIYASAIDVDRQRQVAGSRFFIKPCADNDIVEACRRPSLGGSGNARESRAR